MEEQLTNNSVINKIEFINVKKNQTANIAKARQRAFILLSHIMPTKKTPVKKTTKVTANFSANVPEEIIECCHSSGCGSNKKRHKKSGPGNFYILGMI